MGLFPGLAPSLPWGVAPALPRACPEHATPLNRAWTEANYWASPAPSLPWTPRPRVSPAPSLEKSQGKSSACETDVAAATDVRSKSLAKLFGTDGIHVLEQVCCTWACAAWLRALMLS